MVSTRAVVERLQQIGMLRALGYRRSLVQHSFLMESSLIAILGSVGGAWMSYRIFAVDKTFGSNIFHLPVVEIAGFLILAYLITLLSTYLPARSLANRAGTGAALRVAAQAARPG